MFISVGGLLVKFIHEINKLLLYVVCICSVHTDKRIQPALRVGFDLLMNLPHRLTMKVAFWFM